MEACARSSASNSRAWFRHEFCFYSLQSAASYLPLTCRDLSVKMDHQLWLEIIEPTSYINHEALRDELQMTVLSYDDDVLGQDGSKQTSLCFFNFF